MKLDRSYRDYDLLTVIAAGNEKAFSILFEGLKDKVYRCALHATQSAADAEQITQEVFLTVWMNKASLPDMPDIDAGICTITSNACFNQLQKMAQETKRPLMTGRSSNVQLTNIAATHRADEEIIVMLATEAGDEFAKRCINLAWNHGSAAGSINEKCSKKILSAVFSHNRPRFVPQGHTFLKRNLQRVAASVLIMAMSAFLLCLFKYLPALQRTQHFIHAVKK